MIPSPKEGTAIGERVYRRQSYVYDINNQLIRENNLDTNKTIIYTYDEGGNLLNKRRYDYSTAETPTGVSYNTGYAYDSVWKDKLVTYMGQSITYDSIGNPINYRGATIDWFGRQMQSYSKGNTSINYKYDSDGLRTQKVVNGVQYDYYYVDGQLRYEKKGDEYEIIYRYNNDGTLASVTRNRFSDGKTDILYAVTNTRGDVIELRSGNGAVNTVYTYDSWGKLISVTNASGTALASTNLGVQNSIRYRGYVYDTETGLYYLQSRYYDPETGRFLNADDVDFIGASGTVLGYNAFAYCENNAVNKSDSSGYVSQEWKNIAKVAGVCIYIIGLSMVSVVVGGPAGAAISSIAWSGAFGAVYGYIVGTVKDYKQFGKNNSGTNAANFTASYAISYMFTQLGASVAKELLKKLSSTIIKSTDDLIKTATFQRKTSSGTFIYKKNGNFKTAKSDFKALKKLGMKDIKTIVNSKYSGYTGNLGGLKINVRSGSRSGEATLEIVFSKNKTIKIRYSKF